MKPRKVTPTNNMSSKILAFLFFISCSIWWTSCKEYFIWSHCSTCLCRHNSTDFLMKCSYRNLTVIPPPPPSNQSVYLTLAHNTISALTPNTFVNFRNTRLVSIIFFLNSISYIANDTFNDLHELADVVFSGRQTHVSMLANAMVSLKHVPIKKLTISDTRWKQFPNGFFNPLANISNLNLSLVDNMLTEYDEKLYEPLKGLVYLNLRGNHISKMSMSASYVQNLTHLRLDVNHLDEFPTLCHKGKSHFPHLTDLNLAFNHIPFLFSRNYNCLQKLKIFNVNGNLITKLEKHQFVELKSLEVLRLSYIGYSLKKVHLEALKSDSLRKLYFRKNFIEFNRKNKSISFDMFNGCPSLELLNINFNVLSYLNQDDYNKVFRNLTSLKALIMGGGGLKYIPSAITTYLSNLRTLALYHNEIKDVPQHVQKLKNLKRLYLGNNEITSVKETEIPSSIFSPNGSGLIDLAENPLSCGCESLWLILRIQQDPHTFRTSWHKYGYLCHSPLHLSNTPVVHVPISEKTCLLSWNALMIVLVGSSVLIVLLVMLSLLYYFRWNLMYMLFMMRYKEHKVVDRREWQYDVFVAYSIEDLAWVKEKLMPVLEGKDKLKLCIHNRDFEVGKLIVDNIVDNVEKSRKILIVLSNEFAKSGWCQFELDLILRHLIERGQRLLVVVLLEEIDSRYVTKSMRVMLQTTTYLEWGEESQVKQAFYNRLRMLVNKPIYLSHVSRNRKLSV